MHSMPSNKFYSNLNLKVAHNHIPLQVHNKRYTTFKAYGHLFRFTRLHFSLTNGINIFQGVMDDIITNNNIKGV